MFRKHNHKRTEQIPSELYNAIQNQPQRRKRWLVELLVSFVIVALLIAGGVFLYAKLRKTDDPSQVPKSNAQQSTQPPQNGNDAESDSGKHPTAVPQSGTTNDSSVTPPSE